MTTDIKKIKTIAFIDKSLITLKGSIYEKSLNTLRSKYVYKDISSDDYKKDMMFLHSIFNILQTKKRIKVLTSV